MTTAPVLVAATTIAALLVLVAGRIHPHVAGRRGALARPPADRRPTDRFRRRRRREHPPSATDVAAWCDDLVRQLRAGSSLSTALATAPEHLALATLAGDVLTDVGRGHALAAALRRNHRLAPSTDTSLVIGVLAACAELGGPAAAPLERAAVTLRTRAAIAAEQAVHSAQARLSARVLTVMPLGLLALGVLADPGVRSAIASPLGVVLLIGGLLCNGAGWWWMRRILAAPAGTP